MTTLVFDVTVPKSKPSISLRFMRWRVLWALLTRRDLTIQVGLGRRADTEALERFKELRIKALTASEMGLDVQVRSDMVAIIAGGLYEQLKASGAENYIEWRMTAPQTHEPMVLRLQRAKGKTPHELRREAEARVTALEQELSAVRRNN